MYYAWHIEEKSPTTSILGRKKSDVASGLEATNNTASKLPQHFLEKQHILNQLFMTALINSAKASLVEQSYFDTNQLMLYTHAIGA